MSPPYSYFDPLPSLSLTCYCPPPTSTYLLQQLHNMSHLKHKGHSNSKYDHQIHQCHDEVMATGEIIHMSTGTTTSGVANLSVAEKKIHISTKTGEVC
jgi:hypothetical protein